MRITKEIAIPIIQKLTNSMNYNINIMDDQGVIIASSDPKRVDSIHEGAIEVQKWKKPIIIESEESSRFLGAREGVNLPIEFLNEIIGTVGITGKPEQVLELAQMTKITVELMLQQAYLQQQAQFEQQQLHSWMMELMNPDSFDEKKLANHAKHFLKLDLEKVFAVILVEVPALSSLDPLKDLMKRNRLWNEINENIKLYLQETAFMDITHEGLIIIGVELPPYKSQVQLIEAFFNKLMKRNKKLYAETRIAAGGRYSFVSGIRKSYFEASQSLNLMKKFMEYKNISHIDEWGLIKLLDEVPVSFRRGFMEQYDIEKLPPELFNTLQALFDSDHNLTLTAKNLHIHRNTLAYRLESIHQIMNLNPKSMNDLVILKILLLLKQLEK
ncbi:CdaR family transcriptional regulator [Bacillus sp. SCS-153A]|uniref:CdaR family transcriptional regulator n=1 Tax=Rossellomorea sedimentorum TaxID=3115294 RepID=UPI0039061831